MWVISNWLHRLMIGTIWLVACFLKRHWLDDVYHRADTLASHSQMIKQVVFVWFQKDIIEPVRNALDYYTQMQKAIEEEKEKNTTSEKSKQNGLTSKMNGDIKVWPLHWLARFKKWQFKLTNDKEVYFIIWNDLYVAANEKWLFLWEKIFLYWILSQMCSSCKDKFELLLKWSLCEIFIRKKRSCRAMEKGKRV